MKRAPKLGEPALIHETTNTRDVQSLAICDENFKPEILHRMREMFDRPLAGYRLEVVRLYPFKKLQFWVIRDSDGARLTENSIQRHGSNIHLDTTILAGDILPEEALMLADLEQCAALMLVEEKKL